MKRLWNSFKIAISMYSRIPVPRSQWTEENKSYAMCFFPWVGLAVGAIFLGIFYLGRWTEGRGILESEIFWSAALALTPLAVTGGIHMDGFLDTADAIHSYAPRNRRLEILKDPHTGAFAVISCGAYLLCALALYSVLTATCAQVAALGFVLSRTLSGLSVVCFPKAKRDGTVADFAAAARNAVVRNVLLCYLILLCVSMVLIGGVAGAGALAGAGAMFLYYYRMAMDKFGGITGDLAGYFLQMCELMIVAGALVGELAGKGWSIWF